MPYLMPLTLRGFLALAACMAMLAPTAWAQGIPSAEQMIEQLKTAPRTRSLRNMNVEPSLQRNLTVEANNPNAAQPGSPDAPPAKPSLSLLIQFDYNSARVKPESQQALANLAMALQSPELATSKFAVEGHTDTSGRADLNLRLSQLRADAVAKLLAAQGVAQQRLQAAGKGSSELANSAEPTSAENRRVRIVNLD